MARKCPTGFVCSDKSTIWIAIAAIAALVISAWMMGGHKVLEGLQPRSEPPAEPRVIVVQAPAPAGPAATSLLRPDIYPEPVMRTGLGASLPTISVRGPAPPYQQIGILTAEGGSSSSAAPDRTILPLYGRELDPRRSRWNYYTRTDGSNPVQVPVRVRNRICDDDTNGCDEVYNDDSVHVPALGRSFKATVYRRSIFG
jgi:hypothetical protein